MKFEYFVCFGIILVGCSRQSVEYGSRRPDSSVAPVRVTRDWVVAVVHRGAMEFARANKPTPAFDVSSSLAYDVDVPSAMLPLLDNRLEASPFLADLVWAEDVNLPPADAQVATFYWSIIFGDASVTPVKVNPSSDGFIRVHVDRSRQSSTKHCAGGDRKSLLAGNGSNE